uniref:J domain-containing protein n=2 Tax=Schistocephalus solidus TaxID=70667 RepID=A0A0X3P040_SCHSO
MHFVQVIVMALLCPQLIVGDSLYERLGLSRTASKTDIKRKYRKMAKDIHPDQNDDPEANEQFRKLAEAYECLVDTDKRKRYDDIGIDGCKEGDQHVDHNPFANFFGSMFGGHTQEDERTKRGADVILDLPVTLEEIYSGNFVEVIRCNSYKKPSPGTRQCNCRMEMKTQQVGPGRFQMTQQRVCNECPNFTYEMEDHMLDVEIEVGMRDGHTYPFHLEGEPHPDGDNGDLKFIIRQQAHPVFHRRGDDLYTNVSIGLVDALVGFRFDLPHLDGHKVKIERTDITWPGSILRIPKEGMPNFEKNNVRGSLFVTFDVVFPRNRALKEEEKEAVIKIFGSTKSTEGEVQYGTPKSAPVGLSAGLASPVVYNGFISTGIFKLLPNSLR